MCGEPGPGDGSENPYSLKGGASSGRRIHMIWFFKRPGIVSGPVRVAFHSDSAVSRSKLCIYINSYYSEKNLRPTDSVFGSVVLKRQRHFCWSEKFFPTLGLLTSVLMPIASSSVPFPMPEFNRICGEPMDPPAKITSFLATSFFLVLCPSAANSIPWKSLSFPIGRTRVTYVLRRTWRLSLLISTYAVAELLLSAWLSTENKFHARRDEIVSWYIYDYDNHIAHKFQLAFRRSCPTEMGTLLGFLPSLEETYHWWSDLGTRMLKTAFHHYRREKGLYVLALSGFQSLELVFLPIFFLRFRSNELWVNGRQTFSM